MKITVKKAELPKKQIKIDTEFIRLDSALKLGDAVQSGGHAKIVIQDGEVKVNNEFCTARGKKIRVGDCFEFNNIIYEVLSKWRLKGFF